MTVSKTLNQPSSFVCRISFINRYLPSFPTRRSSDLLSVSRLGSRCEFDEPVRHAAHGIDRGQARSGPGTDVPLRDRKSTRLNSSHLGISYAVFCLKKKKLIKRCIAKTLHDFIVESSS